MRSTVLLSVININTQYLHIILLIHLRTTHMNNNQIIDIEPTEVRSSQTSNDEKPQVYSDYVHLDEARTQTQQTHQSSHQQGNRSYNVRIDAAQMPHGSSPTYANTSTGTHTTGKRPSRFSGLVLILVGVLVALIGIPLLILPGPGLLAIGAGLAMIVSGAKRLLGLGRSSYDASAGSGIV